MWNFPTDEKMFFFIRFWCGTLPLDGLTKNACLKSCYFEEWTLAIALIQIEKKFFFMFDDSVKS